VVDGKGTPEDLTRFAAWASIMKKNRCGLGQTAMNPIVTTMANFREIYDKKINGNTGTVSPVFDLAAATAQYEEAVQK
jgi:NADH:ubiquinone oxidoreductase subunit F (NADH-binding)